MKQKTIIQSLFLLVALLVGNVGSVWGAEDDTHDFSQTLSQLLNNNASIAPINIPAQSYPVKEVIITWEYNKASTYNDAVTMSVSVGGNSWGTQSTGSSVSTKSFSGSSLIGAIAISFTNNTGTGTGHGTFKVTKVTLVEGSIVPAYTITAVSNDESKGTVSGTTTITASPKDGYRVSKTTPYTITSGTATISQDGNVFTVTPSSNCTIRINFEEIPSHNVTWNINGDTSIEAYYEDEDITFSSSIENVEGKVFRGWLGNTIEGTTDEEPEFVTSATMGTSDITYYAVFATAAEGEEAKTKTQTLQYDTWSYSGTTDDKDTYRLFGEGSYIESSSFNLEKLVQVDVYAGTYGTLASGKNKVNVTSGSTNWGAASLSTNNAATKNEITSAVDLSGTGTIRIVAGGGNGTNTGIRISKVEIYTMEPTYTYSAYCTTFAARTPVNLTSFTATSTDLIVGGTSTTSVANDQVGWSAAYTYASDDESVATVSNTGVITAVAKGTANITASLNVNPSDAAYREGTIINKSIEITVHNPEHTVNFYINGVKDSDDSIEEGDDITFPIVADPAGLKFLGWTTSAINGIQDDAPAVLVNEATMSTSDINYYAVFAEITGVIPASCTETDLASFTATDVLIIVGNNGKNYALPNDGGTSSAPTAVPVTVSGTSITSEIVDKLKWNVTGNNTDGYTFYTNGSTTTWLYCTNTNNGVRVGTNTNKTFKYQNNYLYHIGTSRYVGIYNSQDWRCYDGYTENNIADQTFKFYKYIAASDVYGNWRTTVTVPVTITSAGRATFSSTNALDFTGADVEAYIAKSTDGSNVTFTSVNVVPANTGLLVKGNEGTYYIPVTTASTDDVSANKMESTASAAHNVTSEEYGKAFVFGKKGDEIGFFKAAIGKTIAQGKSYLLFDVAPAKDVEFIDIIYDNETEEQSETTSISDELRAKSEDTPAYNLAGQKVGKDYKGIVVINGHKVIRK